MADNDILWKIVKRLENGVSLLPTLAPAGIVSCLMLDPCDLFWQSFALNECEVCCLLRWIQKQRRKWKSPIFIRAIIFKGSCSTSFKVCVYIYIYILYYIYIITLNQNLCSTSPSERSCCHHLHDDFPTSQFAHHPLEQQTHGSMLGSVALRTVDAAHCCCRRHGVPRNLNVTAWQFRHPRRRAPCSTCFLRHFRKKNIQKTPNIQ